MVTVYLFYLYWVENAILKSTSGIQILGNSSLIAVLAAISAKLDTKIYGDDP